MSKLLNPYIAGAPVIEARMFFGRGDVFDWVERSLAGQYTNHILVLHGQRRVGKTSVLKQLSNHLPERYIPVFFDLQGRTRTTLDRFLWWLTREITRVLKKEHNIIVPIPARDAFEKDTEYFENVFLPGLIPVIGDRSLLLTFDEFDSLEDIESKDDLAGPLVDYLRRLMEQPQISFIFSIGSSGRKLENMQASYTEFFKTALYKKISFLTKKETANLISGPVAGLLEYDRVAIERIYKIASGHPYFTQLICHELFSRCQESEELSISESDVKAVLDDVVERGTVNLKFVWDEASDLEKWVLAALAQMEGDVGKRSLGAYLQQLRVRFSDSDLMTSLLHLQEKDVITRENHFVIHLLKLWLIKNRHLDQVREELTEANPIANRYIEIGLEFKDNGLYDRAVQSFQDALEIIPDNIQAQVNIAQVYLDQQNLEKAVDEFEKAMSFDDEDVSARAGLCEAHLAFGDQLLTKNRIKQAIQSFQKVLTINAEHTEARQRMAEIIRQDAEKALADGKDESALAAFAEALGYTPDDENLSARYEQAKAEKRTKVVKSLLSRVDKEESAQRWESAIQILENAIEIAPDDEKVQKRLVNVKAEKKKAELDEYISRADRAAQSGRFGLVISALEEYLKLEPDDREIQDRIANARVQQRESQLDEIRTRAKRATESKKWDQAIEIWEEFLDVEPGDNDAEAALENVRILQRQEKLDAIRARAKRATDTKKWDQAIAIWEEFLEAEPTDKDAESALADVRKRQLQEKLNTARTRAQRLAKSEKFDEAIDAWQEYLILGPEDADKAQVQMIAVKNAQRLAKSYAKAQAAFSKKSYGKTIGNLKEIIEQDVNYKNASQLLSQAIELQRTTPKFWKNKWALTGFGSLGFIAIGFLLVYLIPTITN
ncbi:MAG: tetratricopeptide repeat protein, partial [Anaerolineae bacterium]|nr:tetratricopeptide repeat protein [Anaerolineae bacterium]